MTGSGNNFTDKEDNFKLDEKNIFVLVDGNQIPNFDSLKYKNKNLFLPHSSPD